MSKTVMDRVTALRASPTGTAFLIVADHAGLSPEEAAAPEEALHLAAMAHSETFRFRSIHDWLVPAVLAEGPRLLPYATAIMEQPAAAEWFAPLDRAAQEWIGRIDVQPVFREPHPSFTDPVDWERYAQKPLRGVMTTTAVGPTNAALIALRHHTGDYHILEGAPDRRVLEPPYSRWRLRPAAGARVFEVTGPETWHRLCRSYPDRDKEGRLVPDWEAVATEWDGVHLTLGGLLTADQTRFDGEDGWSEHRSWEFEATFWLHWCFAAVERLPDVEVLPDPPLDAHWPWDFRPPAGMFSGLVSIDLLPIDP